MKQRTKSLALAAVALATMALGPSWAQTPELHLIFNVNDDSDHYPADAGTTLEEALDRVKPNAIDSAAEWYFVLLDDSTIEALGLPVKGANRDDPPAAAAVASVSESATDLAGAAQDGSDSEGDTGWIELQAYSASVYYWSETGEGESNWQPDDFRVFIRQLASGDTVAAVGPGAEPPGD